MPTGNSASARKRQPLLERQSVPEARAVTAFTPRWGLELDGDSIAVTPADDTDGAADVGRDRSPLSHSATSDEAIVRTVLRGTSPIAVTLRPRSVVE